MNKKLRYENIPDIVPENWEKFYAENYENPALNYELLLICRHKIGQPELIAGINGDVHHTARRALETLYNKNFRPERGYLIIRNSLIGDWEYHIETIWG